MKQSLLKFSLFSAIFVLSITAAFSQIFDPVKWTFSVDRISDDVATLIFTAKIDKTWHLYSTVVETRPEGNPVATSFTFEPAKNKFQLNGKVTEPKGVTKYDPNFEMNLKLFDKSAVFKQKIKILSADAFVIKGFVEFMCCDDSRCLPPTEAPFELKIEKKSGLSPLTNDTSATIDTASVPDTSMVKTKTDSIPVVNTAEKGKEKTGLLWIFVIGFLGGLLALLTPCVFPMIPMTVSFFLRGKKSKKKGITDALFYGISIMIVYVVLGLGITIIFGANALNAMSTNPIFNILFFLLLLVFAISFFGVFELQMPSKWTNALDSKADKTSGFISIFFMAFTLVLVSFSCTGPIIGTLLVEAAVSGKTLSPIVGMTGFSLALAIPFTLFAVFPSWLKSMPKSGGWLNAIKVVLAFSLLAFSLKFLSTADLVGQWNFLSRPVFLALWIVIFTLMGMYLLGKIKFSHDSEMNHLPVGRLFLAIAVFTFVVYMIPGMFGAPLKLISSFLPPMTTQDFVLTSGGGPALTEALPEGKNVSRGAHGLVMFHDYKEGLDYAKEKGKPVFLDFTGLGCVNCKKMEADVWSDSRVLNILSKDYVIVSLYVDDRTTLPEAEQYISKLGGKERKIKTIGNKWSDFQAEKFGVNSQPYYVLLDNNGNKLVEEAFSFNTDVDAFVKFLEAGKQKK